MTIIIDLLYKHNYDCFCNSPSDKYRKYHQYSKKKKYIKNTFTNIFPKRSHERTMAKGTLNLKDFRLRHKLMPTHDKFLCWVALSSQSGWEANNTTGILKSLPLKYFLFY